MGFNDSCICKECGTPYHHCTSCGYSFAYNEDVFCSEACARRHTQSDKIFEAVCRILDKLDEDGRKDLAAVLFPNEVRDPEPGEPTYYDCKIITGDCMFDRDVVEHVIKDRFRDAEFLVGWGLW